ncbi:plasmid mobilization protein [Halomonas sp. BC2]|uniref:plasmid mobilization protein n=1 Tax=Halomonas sp. BC2 TaxID=1670449 RepID=UPI0009C12B33|nr:relaxase/mobilization nuclease domain-containing protein [Halomonas sp. BC2]
MDVIDKNKNQLKRTIEMKVRVNDIEYKKIKELAYLYGKPMADIFRESALTVSKSHKGGRKTQRADPALIRGIARIGNNLNQIAKQVNSTAKAGDAINVLELIDVLHGIRAETENSRSNSNTRKCQMIVKFRKQKRGVPKNPLRAAKGATGYLLGNKDHKGRERAFKPLLLAGSPDEFEQIVGFGNRAGQYTSGGLYFEETREQLVEKHGSNQAVDKIFKDIMERFEETLFPGLDKDQYCGVWILHEDKSNIELNFIFAKEELRSGKRLNPYFHKDDLQRVNAFKNIINHEYDLSDPGTPDKKRASTPEFFNEYKPVDGASPESSRRHFKKALTEYISQLVEDGFYKNRDELIDSLNTTEYKVSRATKKSISVINPETGKPARLAGAIFEEGADYKHFSSEDYRNELMRRYEEERLEKINKQKEIYEEKMDEKKKIPYKQI